MLTQPTIDAPEALAATERRRPRGDPEPAFQGHGDRPPRSCRAHPRLRTRPPVDPGDSAITVDQPGDVDFEYWRSGDDEIERMKNRIRQRQAEEFDTPWPVRADEVCISFIHIPSLFDDGRSQRIFNLINKDIAFAPSSSTRSCWR